MQNKDYSDTITYRQQSVEIIQQTVLDPIDYAYHGKRAVTISIRQPEFTAVCPMTGLPDFGCIVIEYVPDRKIIELKSLKYYLLQYRNVGIFYEHVVNRILDDLAAVLKPQQMTVRGEFSSRGGLSASVAADYRKPSDGQTPWWLRII